MWGAWLQSPCSPHYPTAPVTAESLHRGKSSGLLVKSSNHYRTHLTACLTRSYPASAEWQGAHNLLRHPIPSQDNSDSFFKKLLFPWSSNHLLASHSLSLPSGVTHNGHLIAASQDSPSSLWCQLSCPPSSLSSSGSVLTLPVQRLQDSSTSKRASFQYLLVFLCYKSTLLGIIYIQWRTQTLYITV